MNELIISIGSNSNDKELQMSNCVSWLKDNFQAAEFSDIYSSPAINGKSPDYLNAVAKAHSPESLDTLVKQFKNYETDCGRTPMCKVIGKIPIDLDIVIWNGTIIRSKDFDQQYFKIGWKQLQKQEYE